MVCESNIVVPLVLLTRTHCKTQRQHVLQVILFSSLPLKLADNHSVMTVANVLNFILFWVSDSLFFAKRLSIPNTFQAESFNYIEAGAGNSSEITHSYVNIRIRSHFADGLRPAVLNHHSI